MCDYFKCGLCVISLFFSQPPHLSFSLTWLMSTLHPVSSPSSWCNYLSTDSSGQQRHLQGHLSVSECQVWQSQSSKASLIESDLIRGGENVCMCVWSGAYKDVTHSLGVAPPGKRQGQVCCFPAKLANLAAIVCAYVCGSAAVADLRI